MKIISFNPYVRWSLHSARQATILHALTLRGAVTRQVLCDGLMPACDLHTAAKGSAATRDTLSCSRCQTQSAYLETKLNQPFTWLGRWLDHDTVEKVNIWASNATDPQSAFFGDWPIGLWVKSSVHSYFRTEVLDLTDHLALETYRAHLAAGAVIASALDAVFHTEKPDTQLLFNGRMAPMRIALELAKQHGVPTYTEERGFAAGHLRLVRDTHCLDPNPFYDLWSAWKDVPLSETELRDLARLTGNHFAGSDFEMPLFVVPPTDSQDIEGRLNVDGSGQLAVLFSSSTDESQDQPEARGIFASQAEWITQTIDWFAAHPQHTLVIRAHPNSGGKRSVGTNQDDLDFFASLQNRLPRNVRVVAPDEDINSFELIRRADLGLVWHSSLGVEMATVGKPVVRAGAYWFRDADFMHSADDTTGYFHILSDLFDCDRGEPETQRTVAAWRFAYCWFFRQSFPFPLVKQPDWAHGEPAYSSIRDLEPGKDDSLDRICDIILNGAPVHPQPEVRPDRLAAIERDTIADFVRRFEQG